MSFRCIRKKCIEVWVSRYTLHDVVLHAERLRKEIHFGFRSSDFELSFICSFLTSFQESHYLRFMKTTNSFCLTNLVLFCCFFLPAKAQFGTWTHSRSSYPTEAINDLCFTDLQNGICAGEAGIIGRTTNGGQSWTPLQPVTFRNLYSVVSINNAVSYICGDSGTVLKSVNGGFNFTLLPFPTNELVSDIFFLNVDTGYALTSTSILKTANGGNTWSVLYNALAITALPAFTDIHFFNQNLGYVTYDNKKLRTYDGGLTWIQSTYAPLPIYMSKYYSPSLGYAVANGSSTVNYYYKTIDSGATWTQVYAYNCQYPQYTRLQILDSNNTVIIADNPATNGVRFHATTNGGTSWSAVENTNFEYSTSLFFTDPLHGHIGGLWGSFANTIDNGQHWTQYNTNVHTGASMDVVDSNIVYIGHRNILERTKNKGLSWQVMNPPGVSSSDDFVQIQFPDTTHGWVLTNVYNLYKTTNACANWTYCGVSPGIKTFHFYDALFGIALLTNSQVAITHNNGTTWSIVTLGTGITTRHLVCVDSLHWYVGSNYQLFKTNNAGASWTSVPNTWFATESLNMIDTNTVYVSANIGFHKSTNGGVNWNQINIPFNNTVIASNYLNAGNGIVKHIAGGYHAYSRTTDSSANWQYFGVPIFKNINATDFHDSDDVWYYTGFGTVWHHQPFTQPPPVYAPFLDKGNMLICAGDSLHISIVNYATYNPVTDTLKAVLKAGSVILQTIPIGSNGLMSFVSPSTVGTYTLEVSVSSSLFSNILMTSITISSVIPSSPFNSFWYQVGSPNCINSPVTFSINVIGAQLALGYTLEFHKIQDGVDSIISNTLYNVISYLTDTASFYYKVILGENVCANPAVFTTSIVDVNIVPVAYSSGVISCSNINNTVCDGASFSLTVTAQNIGLFSTNYEFHRIDQLNQDVMIQTGSSTTCLVAGINAAMKYYCLITPGYGGCNYNILTSTDTIDIHVLPNIAGSFTIHVLPSASACPGDTLTFYTTPNTTQPIWTFSIINGLGQQVIQAGLSDTFTTTLALDQDQYFAEIADSNFCIANPQTNTISISITNLPVPVITFNGTLLTTTNVAGANYVWYLNGILVATASVNSYTPLADGMYTVIIQKNGCSSQVSAGVNVAVTSMLEINMRHSIQIIPNPFSSSFTIQTNEDILSCSLIDIRGVEINNLIIKQNGTGQWLIDSSDLPDGVYFARVHTAGNKYVKKLIKHQDR